MTELVGAEVIIKALNDQSVDHVFGYPGGAVLPLYDELFKSNNAPQHILVRHEQGAVHAAEGYARSTGKPGVVIVTSGPGATNAITGLTDAMMDSVPIVCLTGQVPTHLIGTDAFQEADTIGITRACTKHNWLVKDPNDLARVIHEAFHVATSGRPGPVVVDIPKDIQFADAKYVPPAELKYENYKPQVKPNTANVEEAIELMGNAKRPIFYTGGGVINSGPEASHLLKELVLLTGFPVTSTLMGLGAFPSNNKNWLGMLGMHGTYEANLAMNECDLLINIGARFDDRVTGRLEAFSPQSKKIHVDIDPSSINKTVSVDVPIVADCAYALESMLMLWKSKGHKVDTEDWFDKINEWRKKNSLEFKNSTKLIKPQFAVQRLYELTKDKDVFITTEVGQHQMWAAQHYHFNEPNRWMTSGGLGTMGYGFPAAIGVQVAHPKSLVIDIAGEASILMNIQELSTAIQHKLPVKIFILNNQYMGMVRQWQELLHGGRYSHSYTDSLPDFVKLAEAYGAQGIRAEKPGELDEKIIEMIDSDLPVIFDCVVDQNENCYPMIPAGAAHNEMLLGEKEDDHEVSDEGKVLI
tara:strand:- start:847 stop:2592 length:1746 start_codon:yes stop_codon:yes gene_type:complete